jgi:hypothetical protein
MAKAQVAVPPTTWNEFTADVQAMVVRDDSKNIVQPAAALGTAENIPYFMDILSVIMMQDGAQMTSGSGNPSFAGAIEERIPGVEAFDFYLKFSSPTWVTYTWNDAQLNALEAFTQGNLGFYFGYQSDLEIIQQRAPNLNFSYAKIPQAFPDSPVNYARYSVESVHINSANPDYAWDFLNFASNQKQVASFLESTGRTPAVRALVGEAQQDSILAPFAQQALTAKSWYHGVDPDAAEQAFTEMVADGILGTEPLLNIVGRAQSKVRLTID